jgi:hypothetical protein
MTYRSGFDKMESFIDSINILEAEFVASHEAILDMGL